MEILDINFAPIAARICIKRMAIIRPVVPSSSGHSMALLAKIVAKSMTVCTPELKKKNAYKYFLRRVVCMNSL